MEAARNEPNQGNRVVNPHGEEEIVTVTTEGIITTGKIRAGIIITGPDGDHIVTTETMTGVTMMNNIMKYELWRMLCRYEILTHGRTQLRVRLPRTLVSDAGIADGARADPLNTGKLWGSHHVVNLKPF